MRFQSSAQRGFSVNVPISTALAEDASPITSISLTFLYSITTIVDTIPTHFGTSFASKQQGISPALVFKIASF